MASPHQLQMPRDGDHLSPWHEGLQVQPSTDGKTPAIYDAIIIGGGITGLSTALLLQQSGKKTLLLEAHTIGFGTTGGTSAHINTFADTTFAEAESAFGADGAQLFADAIAEGADLIKNQIRQADPAAYI